MVVVTGVLSSIAMPTFKNTKGRANLGAVKSDLRHVVAPGRASGAVPTPPDH